MSLRRIELKQNVDLKKYTTIKIGGKTKYFFTIRTLDDLRRVVNNFGASFYIIGKGSNLLITDRLIQKPVIKLSEEFNYIRGNGNCVEAGAAVSFSFLLKYCLMNNLGGLESMVGIPATIGGALSMNASSFGGDMSSYLKDVDVMDKKGNIKILKKNRITFGYRFSSLQEYIILGARFGLSEEKCVKQKMDSLLKRRFSSQDFNFPSCGCIFKNPYGFGAGFLVESCGLKGLKRGDAQISTKHANFIINLGSAKYDDVDYLIQKIKSHVYKKYSIILQEEIKRWA